MLDRFPIDTPRPDKTFPEHALLKELLPGAEILPDNTDIRYRLADSMSALNLAGTASLEIQQTIREIIITEAEELIAPIINMDETTSPTEILPPTLSDVTLIMEAYDSTHDPLLRDALDYLFATFPPKFSEELQQAYINSQRTQRRATEEYMDLLSQSDTEINKPTQEDLNFIEKLRKATPPQDRDTSWEHLKDEVTGNLAD